MNVSKAVASAGLISGARNSHLVNYMLMALLFFWPQVDAPALGGQAGRGNAPSPGKDQVILLVVQLANQAQLSQDLPFAVRAQAQAGLLIWRFDHDEGRAILLRAFQPLIPSSSDPQPAPALEREKQELRVELLNQVASCDPEMAERLARSLPLSRALIVDDRPGTAASEGALPSNTAHGSIDAESRELLVDVALRVAEVDSARAMRLGQLSLEGGVSPYFDRLLRLIAETDPPHADRLFSSAVDYLDRAGQVSLADLHPLGFYLIQSDGRWDQDPATRAVVVRFLNMAFDSLTQSHSAGQAVAQRNGTDQSFETYCTGKYLMELLPRYMPDRAAQLQRRLSELEDRQPPGDAAKISTTQSIHPLVTEQAPRDSLDVRERDLRFARAAFGWLARGDMGEAQGAALNISNAEMRDRTLLQIARELTSKARFKDAEQIVPFVSDGVARTDLMVRLAHAAFLLGHTASSETLLDLAELEASRIVRPYRRAESLLVIAADFSPLLLARAFAVMQEAVNAINEVPGRQAGSPDAEKAVSAGANTKAEELFHLDFVNSLTALGRLDFERALALSRQLTDKEISLTAQLAVCRGGLGADSSHQR
jgi:hypothetical protein